MDRQQLKLVIEGAVMASHEPLPVSRLAALFDLDERAANESIHADIVAVLAELQQECAERAYELVEVASGWRFQLRQRFAPWINRLWEEKPPKYSRATMETLALIAYRQPITRGDIEEVRGVAVSTNIIQSLMERNWVRIVGHRDVPGRPALYATTKQFLDYFNLKSLDQLPSLSELRDIDSLSKELPFDDSAVNGESAADANANMSEADRALPDGEDEAAASMVTLFLPGG